MPSTRDVTTKIAAAAIALHSGQKETQFPLLNSLFTVHFKDLAT